MMRKSIPFKAFQEREAEAGSFLRAKEEGRLRVVRAEISPKPVLPVIASMRGCLQLLRWYHGVPSSLAAEGIFC